jgi:glycosyltransferase involved in cell wall biosynthesis
MERQSEELVRSLLESGRPVTVVARTCALSERSGLRFMRVPTPARPFTIAYPAFFLVGSLLAARRRGALLHTTGAIIANRADVSTVHYCHHAAVAHVADSRASRSGRLYRLNAAVAKSLSLAAERWCYRPGRTRVLCAVSGGVASELRQRFPAMRGAVRTVPNGVDATTFRPDPTAGRQLRGGLGIGDHDSVAVFAGGDWERKGLRFAVDAIALAPGWHLLVAGEGDRRAVAAQARKAGVETRVHLLGPIRAMSQLYAAANAFVLPSAYETFSLVTFEAAATGLPLLVTHVSGVEDLLSDGANGWFIARDARDIARRMNELRSRPELARRLGECARKTAGAFSWDAMAEGYASVYEDLECGAHRAGVAA